MKKTLIILLMFFPALCPLLAQNVDMLGAIRRSASELSSLECEFTQKRISEMLTEPVYSNGKMYYCNPDMLRWEYTSPVNMAFILKCNRVQMMRDGRIEEYGVNANKMMGEIARLILGSVSGQTIDDSRDYEVSVREEIDDGSWAVTLIPKRKDLKKMWKQIVLYYDPIKKHAKSIRLIEPSGDSTLVMFKNVRLNEKIASSAWNL